MHSRFLLAITAALFGGAAQAVTQSWSVGNGTWDTVTGNWTGGSTWTNGNEAIFNNTAAATTVTLGEAITAAAVKIGNGGNNANYAFSGSSLAANSLTVQGNSSNNLGTNPTATFNDLSLSLSGDLGVGRAYLNISGNSIIVADRIGGGGMTGITSADWGQVTLSGNANVTVTNGIVGGTTAWGLNLNGGSLTTKRIDYGPHTSSGKSANLVFNGTRVKANATNANFITVSGGLDSSGPTAPDIQAGGAKIDTDGYDIGIQLALAGSGGLTKSGNGKLTLSGGNSYAGVTEITNGTLLVTHNTGLGAGGHNAATMSWIRNGATLALQGGVSINEHFHFWGSGVGGLGAVRSLSGNNSLTDSYCLRSDVVVGVDADTLTVNQFYQEGGSYGMTKVGAGTMVFAQANTYTGPTIVSNGTLRVTQACLADGATVSVATGAKIDLAFSGLDTVGSVVLGGVPMPIGRYTAVTHSAYISGTGTLFVTGLEYAWNTGNGIWDTITPNWTGGATVWANDNDALFTNMLSATTVNLNNGAISAGRMKIGNAGNNANYTFTNGSLSAASIALQANGGNGSPSAATAQVVDTTLAVVGGDIGIGRMGLVIGGSSTVTVSRIGGAGITGISSADWGQLTIRDRAVVTLANGIVGNTTAWGVNLDGGTLTTKGIEYGPHTFTGGNVNLKLNGTLVKANATNANFITVSGGLDTAGPAAPDIQAGGAKIDTDGYDIGISVPLAGSGTLTKLGAGTLTLSGASTYTGSTVITNGMLVASNNVALGAGGWDGGTMTWIRSGATLALAGGVSLDEHMHLLGSGVDGKGALRSLSGNNALTLKFYGGSSGPGFCFDGDTTVGVDAGTLTVTGFYQDGTVARSMTKVGAGTLVFSQTSTYTGSTIVSNGTLRLTLPCLADGATVSVATGAKIDLAFSGVDAVAAIILGGTPLPAGRYTAASNPAFISGSGVLVIPRGEYSWNTGSGIWDTTTANWAGLASVWTNDNHAVFTNTAAATTVTLGVPISAGAVKVGNGGNNANYTFTGGSLSAASITMQGNGANGSPASATARFIDATVDVSGSDIGIGRMGLVIGGSSTVTASRIGGLGAAGITSADWGQLTIQDNAVVTLAGGIFGNTTAWGVNLDGGTLTTKGINYGPHGTVDLKFNGTLVKASETNLNFITSVDGTGVTPIIQPGGAKFDSNGFDLGIGVGLQGSGGLTKLGAGTLTLSGASSYEGGTTISNGTVNASFRAIVGGNSALGKAVPASVVTIENGGVLTGSGDNWLDNTALASDAANAHTVVINAGGLLKGKNGAITGLGNVTLKGGMIEVSNGLGGSWNASFTLGGDITVSGTVPSAITTAAGAGATACVYMADGSNGSGGTNTFTVNDVTGTPAADLTVGARLAKGTVIKAGAGTLALVAGATGTETPVNWQVNGGTLQVGTLGAMPSCDVAVNVDGAFEPGSGAMTLGALSGNGTLRVSTDSALTVASVPAEATLKIAIADPQNLDVKQQYTVLTATGTLAGTPSSSSLPPRWVVFKDGNTWKIKALGMIIRIF